MTESPPAGVDPARPDSPIRTHGLDHITLEGTNLEETIAFYRDLLGMSLVLEQPNLDRKELTHLFFDTGDGRMLTFFVSQDRVSRDLDDPEPGRVHHLAFRIDGDRIDEIADALEAAGYPVSEFDRGVFHSLYTADNNGHGIELVSDKFAVPGELRGKVLATAHRLRVEDGASFVETEHMREAIGELGLDVEERSLGDAPTGRDY